MDKNAFFARFHAVHQPKPSDAHHLFFCCVLSKSENGTNGLDASNFTTTWSSQIKGIIDSVHTLDHACWHHIVWDTFTTKSPSLWQKWQLDTVFDGHQFWVFEHTSFTQQKMCAIIKTKNMTEFKWSKHLHCNISELVKRVFTLFSLLNIRNHKIN